MKSLLLLAGLAAFSALQADETVPFRVLTFNLRYENKSDGADGWTNRRATAAKLIEDQADVAGLQEAKPAQRTWLAEHLPAFGLIGVGRKANDSDEAVPVLYRKDRFEPLTSGTFWLSETPEVVGSISWESSLPRICTWVKFRDRKASAGKDVFWFYNVHLDHRSAAAREHGLAVVHDHMATRPTAEPVILTGDFNSTLKDAPLAKLVAREKPALVSTYHALGVTPEATCCGFTGAEKGSTIDYIFTQKDVWKVRSGAILKVTVPNEDGKTHYVSDHFQVQAVIESVR